MTHRRLRLRTTADPEAAVVRLKELVAAGPRVTTRGVGAYGVPIMRDEFLTWSEQVENVLGEITDDPEVIAELFTSRYCRIRQFETDWR